MKVHPGTLHITSDADRFLGISIPAWKGAALGLLIGACIWGDAFARWLS